MRQVVTILAAITIFCNASFGQDKDLIVQGASPDIYLLHIVKPKENYYSVGRMYNVAPKELASYNNIVFEKGLSLGITLKVPLNQNNFNQGAVTTKDEALIPLYHIVQPKEGLYRVSVTYNKVPVDKLKKWNKLGTDAVSVGTKLIIGYLKVSKEQSPLALKGETMLNPATSPVAKTDIPQVTKKTGTETSGQTTKTSHVSEPVSHESTTTHSTEETDKSDHSVTVMNDKTAVDFAGGYFKKLYTNQTESKTIIKENGLAGTFKTTSGWSDGKYYCFHNEATPGTIMKITNTGTGKSIFAKVLDAIPDIKQNGGLLIRLSNAAASELGAADPKFDCSVSYTK